MEIEKGARGFSGMDARGFGVGGCITDFGGPRGDGWLYWGVDEASVVATDDLAVAGQ